jgi:YVTN family beta-propeller protein
MAWMSPSRAAALAAGIISLAAPGVAGAQRATFSGPTTSSAISISADGRLVWVVNPGADTVSVIRAGTDKVLRSVRVGDEPQAVALDPANRYAYVANAASNSVTIIRITDPRVTHFRARVDRTAIPGAEPWNIVASPDGRRVYVANASQDTVAVMDTTKRPRILGAIDIGNSRCNDPDRLRHFQPRGLAVTSNSRHVYVTSFLSFVKPGGRQADDNGREAAVCRIDVKPASRRIRDYRPAARITLGSRITGFTVDSTNDGVPDATSAFPNQLQSIVIRGNTAYLPNIAASPDGPLRFNVSTQAFVNTIDGVRGRNQVDSSAARFLNLHLGARDPEPGKKKLFFANPWAVAFTTASGAGAAYVVSAASDLLVKVNVAADGTLSNTVDADTTRYIDLAPTGHKPQGIAINAAGTKAYVANALSRNVSVVDLRRDQVIRVIPTAAGPPPGSPAEVVAVGAQMFFSSRGQFNRAPGMTTPGSERLSSDGWQSCSSCHFQGLTDGVVWEFATGPRKSVPLNATFNPGNRNEQRVLNYSAIFDEIEDFEINIRNVSGPGPLAAAQNCSAPPPATATNDPNHGLIVGDADPNLAPCVVNAFGKPNAERRQETVTLPGSTVAVPAMTALREWVRAAVRTPNPPLSGSGIGALRPGDIAAGRTLFQQAGCATCHFGGKFTLSTKDFTAPPAAGELFTETSPAPRAGTNPVNAQYLNRFLRDIGSWNLGVPGKGNDLGADIGADEHAAPGFAAGRSSPPQDGLGLDFNGDGKGNGFNVPSLLGILQLPPYYHNGACESLACVVGNAKHRTANGTLPDRLTDPRQQALVIAFLRSIGVRTPPLK